VHWSSQYAATVPDFQRPVFLVVKIRLIKDKWMNVALFIKSFQADAQGKTAYTHRDVPTAPNWIIYTHPALCPPTSPTSHSRPFRLPHTHLFTPSH